MGIVDKILGRKPFDPDARRRFLLENGRITDGTIIDTKVDGDGQELVVFVYTLNGVDFESADALIALMPGEHQRLRFGGAGSHDLAQRGRHRDATFRVHGVQPFAGEEIEKFHPRAPAGRCPTGLPLAQGPLANVSGGMAPLKHWISGTTCLSNA